MKSEPQSPDVPVGERFALNLSKRNLFLIWLVAVVLLGFVGDVRRYVTKLFAAPPPVPLCLQPYSGYVQTGIKSLPPAGTAETDARDMSLVWGVRDAARICTTESCDTGAVANYRQALHRYFESRVRHTHRLDIQYGAPGFARAQRLYQTADDLEIEQGLRERQRAKVYRINADSFAEQPIRVLLFRGADALRACRRAGG
jgi:hypothetical protein